jgi:fibronectin type 3 domain-containing protein
MTNRNQIKMHRSFKSISVICIMILLTIIFPKGSSAQQRTIAPPALRAILPADSTFAYIYHTLTVPPGHGVLLYRSLADGEEVLLDSVPVMLSFDPAIIQQRAGKDWPALLEATKRNDALSAIIALRQDAGNANMMTFLSPQIADVLARRLVDPSPVTGRNVTYRVEIVNDLAEPIGRDLSGSFNLAPVRPVAPTGLEAENLGYNVRLSWVYPQFNPAQDDAVTLFQPVCMIENGLERIEVTPKPVLRTLETNTFSTLIPVEESGSSVTCQVSAISFAGTPGIPSREVSIRFQSTVPLPVAENPVVEQTGGFDVKVQWNITEDDPVSGYHLYRSETATEGFSRVTRNLIPRDQTSFTDKVPNDQMAWFYAIKMIGTDGKEGELSQPGFTIVRDITPPSTPQNFVAKPQDNKTVLLQWEDPNPAPDLLSYIILRVRDNPVAGPAWTQINPGNDLRETSFIDEGEAARGFSEGDYYRYAIVAIDNARNRSDTLFARIQIPDNTPPVAPSWLTAAQADGFRVNLNWNASPDGDVVSYILYRREGEQEQKGFSHRATLTGNLQFFRDEEVTPGQTYNYQVTAVDSVGNESAPSPLATIMVRPADPPADVRNVRVETATDGRSAEVFWEPVRSPHLAGYRIYRSNMSTGVYEPVAETSRDQTQWTDSNTNNQRWWYKVYAVDVAGVQSRMAEAARATFINE